MLLSLKIPVAWLFQLTLFKFFVLSKDFKSEGFWECLDEELSSKVTLTNQSLHLTRAYMVITLEQQ